MSNTTPAPVASTTQPFESALAQLKAGKHVRRTEWPAGCFVSFDPSYVWPGREKATGNIQRHFANGDTNYMSLSSQDIVANDWEIL